MSSPMRMSLIAAAATVAQALEALKRAMESCRERAKEEGVGAGNIRVQKSLAMQSQAWWPTCTRWHPCWHVRARSGCVPAGQKGCLGR
eukprot:scaffold94725_cov16-Tisochrysis_lutea.AAC.2